ncbi:hypothetical protein AMTRI_Chr08g162670 [Amborella trichopoda]
MNYCTKEWLSCLYTALSTIYRASRWSIACLCFKTLLSKCEICPNFRNAFHKEHHNIEKCSVPWGTQLYICAPLTYLTSILDMDVKWWWSYQNPQIYGLKICIDKIILYFFIFAFTMV